MNIFYIDSCSLIYLKKSNILVPFLKNFRCATSNILLREAKFHIPWILVKEACEKYDRNLEDSLFEISKGDPDSIYISDDRRFINVCKRRRKVVINSLIVPLLMYKKGLLTFQKGLEAMDKIFSVGFYSVKVYQFAIYLFFESYFFVPFQFPF